MNKEFVMDTSGKNVLWIHRKYLLDFQASQSLNGWPIDCCLYYRANSHPPCQLTILREGSFFGEVAILRNAPRAATIRELADVEVYALKRDGVLQLARADANFNRYLKNAALRYSG
jgi:CRP-like cAMP-binding protein